MLSESFSWSACTVLSTLVVLSALTVTGTSTATTVCPTCGIPAMEKDAEERYLVEIAKQQILNKLHLRERPNITHAVPRAALMTALRKLHAGRVRQDGTLELDNNLPNSLTNNQAYEIVSFADVDDEVSPGLDTSLSFQFLQEKGHSVQVLQSSLWLYVRPADAPRPGERVNAEIYLSGANNRTLLIQRSVEVSRGGWHTFPVTAALQAFLDGGQRRLKLQVHCEDGERNLCVRDASGEHQPFLVAQVRLREDASTHALSKRSLRCGDDVSVCCKKDLYIKFRDIQWQDWIIAPEGYHMNYCMGQCPQHLSGSPGIASSFHATVFSQLKANGIQTAVSSCCVPIQRRPLSMVYFNSQHTIVKTDVPDMIVESCGCT
ncbi:inhibin beta B chain [Pimephales promelas]|uniref:inhibin beta B chain n=1 Tax=Pimephales promelas TaxID=90988 RepID=UPI00195577AC|nr:inhibin beta B chain [Pimephales promelas]KAG1930163.1 inhibin beta B chain-like [Pimephales promelas]